MEVSGIKGSLALDRTGVRALSQTGIGQHIGQMPGMTLKQGDSLMKSVDKMLGTTTPKTTGKLATPKKTEKDKEKERARG